MLLEFYSNEVRVVPRPYPPLAKEPAQGPSKPNKVEIQNFDAVPTFEQFRYHYELEVSPANRQTRRLGARSAETKFKQLFTGTLKGVRGPGTRYYIDATVLDVYCVSRLNRNRIVGRPTLYLVVDQFSRLIVGMYVGLEPPCWAGAMLALFNACIDKVAFCATYGVPILPGQWPTGYIPVHLMGDRGELASNLAEMLVVAFNLDVENARPFAGDAKGVGERAFGVIQAKFGPYMPGYVDKDFLGRDAEPAALRAALDIVQITRAIILSVMHANHRVVRDYEAWPEVVEAGVPFQPIELWNWGVKNLQFDGRQFDLDYVKWYLWPRHSVKLTRRGLQFQRGLYFQGHGMAQQPWFTEAFLSGKQLEALYHPLDLGELSVLSPEARTGTFAANPAPRSSRLASGALSEIAALQKQGRIQNAEAYWRTLPIQLGFEEQIHETVKVGKRETKSHEDGSQSRSGKLRDIRNNRAAEITAMTSEASGTPPVDTVSASPWPSEDDRNDHGANAAVQNLIARRLASR